MDEAGVTGAPDVDAARKAVDPALLREALNGIFFLCAVIFATTAWLCCAGVTVDWLSMFATAEELAGLDAKDAETYRHSLVHWSWLVHGVIYFGAYRLEERAKNERTRSMASNLAADAAALLSHTAGFASAIVAATVSLGLEFMVHAAFVFGTAAYSAYGGNAIIPKKVSPPVLFLGAVVYVIIVIAMALAGCNCQDILNTATQPWIAGVRLLRIGEGVFMIAAYGGFDATLDFNRAVERAIEESAGSPRLISRNADALLRWAMFGLVFSGKGFSC